MDAEQIKKLGFGAAMGLLSNRSETHAAMTHAASRTIAALAIIDNKLRLAFTDGTAVEFFDDAQSCCEYRHMSTDDDLTAHVGAKLVSVDTKSAPDIEDEYGSHECEFLELTTSAGSFAVVNHNEHNGYYGGFDMCARIVAPTSTSGDA